ncbi:GSCOCG00010537001-RA-CDS, partial [Cotesia congregata]
MTRFINSPCNKGIIMTDSKSSLEAIANPNTKNPMIVNIQEVIHKCSIKNKEITLIWIPSHVGITCNEKADELAKTAAQLSTLSNTKVPPKDLNIMTHKKRDEYWNTVWLNKNPSKLREIRQNIWQVTPQSLNRNDQCILTRLRIGHTNFTHKYLMERQPPPRCQFCQTEQASVKHWLIQCTDLENLRRTLKIPASL